MFIFIQVLGSYLRIKVSLNSEGQAVNFGDKLVGKWQVTALRQAQGPEPGRGSGKKALILPLSIFHLPPF